MRRIQNILGWLILGSPIIFILTMATIQTGVTKMLTVMAATVVIVLAVVTGAWLVQR